MLRFVGLASFGGDKSVAHIVREACCVLVFVK